MFTIWSMIPVIRILRAHDSQLKHSRVVGITSLGVANTRLSFMCTAGILATTTLPSMCDHELTSLCTEHSETLPNSQWILLA